MMSDRGADRVCIKLHRRRARAGANLLWVARGSLRIAMNDEQRYRRIAVEMSDWEDNTNAARANIADAYEKFQQELPAKVIDEALTGETRNDFDPEEIKILRDMWTAIEAHINWCQEQREPRYTVDGTYEFAKNVINQILYIKSEHEIGE
jgi:hypothetical protein